MHMLNEKLNFHVRIKSRKKHFYIYFLYSNFQKATGS